MSKSKEELLKEFNAKVEDLRQELLEKLKIEENKKFEVDLPDNGEKFHFIDDSSCDIDYLYYREKLASHEMRWKNGMLFESAEEAEKILKERRLLFTIQEWAKIRNEGWKPDLTNHRQEKWSIVYNIRVDGFIPHNMRVFNYLTHDLPYFKSRKVAQDCIKEFEEEIKEVLL